MKNFQKFAVALVVIVIVIFIGLACKTYWGPAAWSMVQWICNSIGIEPPQGLKNILDQEDLKGTQGGV